MKDTTKSPDDVLLYCAAKAMLLAYKGFGVNPLAVQFRPALYAIAISSLAFLIMSVDVDPYYLLVAGLCALWAIRFWRNLATLRADSMKEWSADLYRTYGGKAAVLRTQTAWVRYLMLFGALGMTLISFSDFLQEISRLSTWQRCIFPLDIWALVALAYSMSAEPPEPDDGDRFKVAHRA
jgi:hypothetical protein